MNTKIILVIGLLILIGGGIFFLTKKSSSPVTTTGNQTGNAIEGTLKSLLTGGKSVKCTFTNQVEGATSEGTVYVAGEKMRGDFKTNTQGASSNSHMIVDSQFSYIWTDESNQGFKFPVGSEASPGTQGTADEGASANNQPINLDEKVNYSCQDWSTDNSLFTLPSNVTFSTFTIPGASGSPESNQPSNPCAACANLPAEAQQACKTQLNCE